MVLYVCVWALCVLTVKTSIRDQALIRSFTVTALI